MNNIEPNNKIDSDIKIDYLAKHPEWVPVVAEWTYNMWYQYDPTLTVEGGIERIKTRLNTDRIPLTLIAIDNNNPIGTVNLKESVPVLNVPKNKVWLGSIYIDPKYRGKGIGSMMLRAICDEAVKLGQNEIYLFSSDPSVSNWYKKYGWETVDQLPYQNHIATIMRWTN